MSSDELNKDSYIKSLFEEAGIEHPSSHFTSKIISRIKAESKESAFIYKPVISRTAWRIIAFLGLLLFIYLLFAGNGEGQGINLYGYTLNLDTSKIKTMFDKIAFSFEFSPIMKTSFITLIFFTFSNLIIFELKNRSFFK